MIRKGERNLITDVPGLKVGNAEDHKIRTGVTVVLPDKPMAAAADIRGGAPGTRETAALDPVSLVDGIDGLFLSGGSAFGLDAGGGVQAHLKAIGRGYEIAPGLPRVPVVAGAILFDLNSGGDKDWGDEPPYRALGKLAAEQVGLHFRLGDAGAGLGAVAGGYKGGLGSASSVLPDGTTVGALVAVNAVGSPLMPGSDAFWAWPFELDGEFGGRRPMGPVTAAGLPRDMKGRVQSGTNTTIAVVATDADLTRVELKRLAIMAADGFARALRPVHTPFDGDLVYAVSTGRRPIDEPRPLAVLELGSLAADTLARAIARGVYAADSLGPFRSYRDIFAR
ncbi:P1 family peptidase [Rhizomicrobium electricum]|uniref:P1 family peptidase n=1 Tax=Rhizomicrobium electricum TaxID=480070 RepID=A0ABP3Q8H6_9PROT|nr:P1 family peptidase [Rhizomicrobium electricum]